MSNCGIYYIQNKITKQLYIGQSISLHERLLDHKNKLRKNKHHNTYLQNSFNKYGEGNFEFKVLEHCEPSQLDELEIAYINMYNAKKHGFNILDGGVDTPITKRVRLSDNTLKMLYKDQYTSREIAEMHHCSRRTINRRLKKIFSKKELDELKLKKVREKNPHRINLDDDLIVEMYIKGYSCTEIGQVYSCGHEPICKRLKQILDTHTFEKYKKSNKMIKKEELSMSSKEKVDRIKLIKELDKEQEEITKLYESEGLTDEVLEAQIELNKKRNTYDIPDESEFVYGEFVQ